MEQKTSKEISYENSLEMQREMQREMDYQDWCYFGADSEAEKPVEISPILLLKQLRDAIRYFGV